MEIRLADINDAEAISELLVRLTKKYIAVGFSAEGAKSMLNSMQPEAISHYLDMGYRYHVGEINNAIVGIVATRNESHLYHLFVNESEQGKGYARQLWQIAKAACLAAGNSGKFTVNSSLNAQSVYKNWGFVPLAGIRETKGVKDMPMQLVLKS